MALTCPQRKRESRFRTHVQVVEVHIKQEAAAAAIFDNASARARFDSSAARW